MFSNGQLEADTVSSNNCSGEALEQQKTENDFLLADYNFTEIPLGNF